MTELDPIVVVEVQSARCTSCDSVITPDNGGGVITPETRFILPCQFAARRSRLFKGYHCQCGGDIIWDAVPVEGLARDAMIFKLWAKFPDGPPGDYNE